MCKLTSQRRRDMLFHVGTFGVAGITATYKVYIAASRNFMSFIFLSKHIFEKIVWFTSGIKNDSWRHFSFYGRDVESGVCIFFVRNMIWYESFVRIIIRV